MTSIVDSTKSVYIIVHGQRNLVDKVKEKLALKGFGVQKMQNASLDKAGHPGEYVAMVWPPMAPREIVVNEIIGLNKSENDISKSESKGVTGMGAWSTVEQKELYRISLE
jgi:hypothetical protein